MAGSSLLATPGQFDTAEFAEWLNYDGALEALSPTSLTSNPHPTLTSIGSISPSDHPVKSHFIVTGIQDAMLTPPTTNKKRKSFQTNQKAGTLGPPAGAKKTSHNVIEKRYRSNLNDKIAALRESIPVLRSASRKTRPQEASSDSEGSDAGSSPHSRLKYNKATVLVKATEYIKQLEKQNERLMEENSLLRNRLHGVQTYSVASTVPDEQRTPSESSMTDLSLLQPPSEKAEESSTVPQSPVGLMPAPDEFRRLWASASQEHYAPPDDTSAGPRGRVMSRLLLGSLATLMVMEGLSENEADHKTDGSGSRGLFALPSELLTESRGFREPIRRRIIAFVSSLQGRQFTTLSKLILLTIIFFSFLVYLMEYAHRSSGNSPNAKLLAAIDEDNRATAFRSRSSSSSSVRAVTPPGERKMSMSVRQWFARQAVGWLGCLWLESNAGDEEAVRRPSLRTEDFRRRYKAYADLLPKLLEDGQNS